MKPELPKAQVTSYTDFQGLADLRRTAKDDPRAALETVAKQFEAQFMDMLLKNMREAELGDGLFDSNQSDFYREMLDHELALSLSQQGALGLATLLVRQLEGTLQGAGAPTQEGERQTFAAPERTPLSFRLREPVTAQAPAAQQTGGEPGAFETPEQFVQHLWSGAEAAAKELGVATEALLAQAALETGWGRAITRSQDGRSSYNLFNIKADNRWDGERVAKTTLEYRDGVTVKERAEFRAYGSYEESFGDYVRFLRENPRYRDALAKAGDPMAFINALQDAGYATDPAYARKIERIMGSESLTDVAQLKISSEQTLF